MPKIRRMPRQFLMDIDTSTYSGRFAVRLRALREKSGMSVPELSRKTVIPKLTLYRWEQADRDPPLNALPILAKALGVSVRALMPKE